MICFKLRGWWGVEAGFVLYLIGKFEFFWYARTSFKEGKRKDFVFDLFIVISFREYFLGKGSFRLVLFRVGVDVVCLGVRWVSVFGVVLVYLEEGRGCGWKIFVVFLGFTGWFWVVVVAFLNLNFNDVFALWVEINGVCYYLRLYDGFLCY